MKNVRSMLKYLLSFFIVVSVIACKESSSIVNPDENLSDYQALLKLVDEDESLQSFEPNYNEDEAMSLAGGLAKQIYPVRVGQKMLLVDRNLDVIFEGDTAIGTLTSNFNGTLFIAASYDEWQPGDSAVVDTLIQKQFSTTVTRKIMFVKFENTLNPERNWKIVAVSLPEGGTGSSNIDINKMTILLPDGDVIEVGSPNDYFLNRMPGVGGQIPLFSSGEEVTVTIELQSAYADTDFVTLTYGALHGGPHHRAKQKFELISESFDGQFYQRIYEQTWIVGPARGHKHAIVNAMPKQVIFDDETPVEENSWGMPYIVR